MISSYLNEAGILDVSGIVQSTISKKRLQAGIDIRQLSHVIEVSNVLVSAIKVLDLSGNHLVRSDLPFVQKIIDLCGSTLTEVRLRDNNIMRYNYSNKFDNQIVKFCESLSVVDVRDNPMAGAESKILFRLLGNKKLLSKLIFLDKNDLSSSKDWYSWCTSFVDVVRNAHSVYFTKLSKQDIE